MTERSHVHSQGSRKSPSSEARESHPLGRSRSLLKSPCHRLGPLGIQPTERCEREFLAVTESYAGSARPVLRNDLGKWPNASKVHSSRWNNQHSRSSGDFRNRSVLLDWNC